MWINSLFINNTLLLSSINNNNEYEIKSRFRLSRFRNISISKFPNIKTILRKTLIRLLKFTFFIDLINNIINFLKTFFFRFSILSTHLTNLKLLKWKYRYKIFSKLFIDYRFSFSIYSKKTFSFWKIRIFVSNFESNENIAKRNRDLIQRDYWIHSSFRQKIKKKKLIINLIYIQKIVFKIKQTKLFSRLYSSEISCIVYIS